MSSKQTPRELLAQADRERATVSAAEWARTNIRLGERPVQREGLLRFRKKRPEDRECVFDAAQTAAIYGALAIVRDNARRRAEELEARVTATTPAETTEAGQ